MRRRSFIVASGLGAVTALGGCLGGTQTPPPRKSSVISSFGMADGSLTIDIADDTWVMSRYENTRQSLGGLNPVGVAGAQKGGGGGGGRGATGRGTGGYSSAPRTGHGYAWYHGGDYADDWYEDHGDEVSRYPVGVATLGVAYLGSTVQIRDDAPGVGPVPWDETFRSPEDVVRYDLADEGGEAGWYRVGANVVGAEADHDFRWTCYDLEVGDGTGAGYTIDETWKVSPRI